MTATRRIAALPIIGAALMLIAFGIVRGASSTGPASGTRLIVKIDPPVDAAALAIAEHVVRARTGEKYTDTRVVAAGDHLIVELAEQDPEVLRLTTEILERTAKLELWLVPRPFPPTPTGELLFDGRAIKSATVPDDVAGMVAITVRDAAVLARVGKDANIGVYLQRKLRFFAVADRVVGSELHVFTKGGTEKEFVRAQEGDVLRAAHGLVDVIEAGAAHPMHVVERAAFTGATGFLPRAWPFLAIGLLLFVVAAFVGWRRAPVPA